VLIDEFQPDLGGIVSPYCLRRTSLPRRCPDQCSACKDTDDHHGRAAIRTGEGGLDGFVGYYFAVGFVAGRCHLQQFPRFFQVILVPRIGQQAIMTDAVEPTGQHVQQEPAHELILAEGHGLVAGMAFGPVILIPERDTVFIGGDQPLV